MNPAEYCTDKCRDSGYDHLYRFLFRNESAWRFTRAIRALEHHLLELIENTEQADVAMRQVAWWNEEFERMFSEQPRHPVTRELLAAGAHAAVTTADTTRWLESIAAQIDQSMPSADEDWQTRTLACSGPADIWIAAHLYTTKAVDIETEWLTRYTISRMRARQFLELGHHLRIGHTDIALTHFDQHNINADKPLDAANQPGLESLTNHLHQLASDAVNAILANPRPMPALLVTSHVHKALLTSTAGTTTEVLDQKTLLTPLRQVWIARRARA